MGLGQGHKDWCGLPVLEEDVEWEVSPVLGKGVGLVATALIPPLARIVVSGAKDIVATGGGMRMSLNIGAEGRARYANHACDANAHRVPETDFKV